MQLPSFLHIFTRHKLNGELEATREAGRQHGRNLAVAYVDGVQAGIDDVFAVAERRFLGLPETEVIEGEVVKPARRRSK